MPTTTPGAETTIKHGERVIAIDDLLVSPVFAAATDEAKDHYDVRGTYTSECGYALANPWDKNVLQTLIQADRCSAIIDGGFSGSTIEGGANILTNASSALMQSGAQLLDEKDVPENCRYAALKPAQYDKLVLDDIAINRNITAGNGGIGTPMRSAL